MNMNMLSYRKTVKSIKVSNIDLLKIPDGTYTGSSKAVVLYAKVEVTMKDHEIVKIVLQEHMYGKGGKAEIILQRVINSQSLDVDTVSGIKAAVRLF